MSPLRLAASITVLAFVAIGSASAQTTDPKAIHDSLLTLDTHLDTPANFGRPGWDIMDRHKVSERSQVDYPRMVEGGLKGGFFAIYTPQGPRTPEGDHAARDFGIMRGVEIREMVAKHSDKFELALKADDAAAIMAKGKRFVFMSMENSYPIEGDISLMSTFQAMGVRLIGPAHFKNNDLADSATDKPEWHGLSPLGKQFVAEANRLGLILDASHSSDDVLDQMMALSKTPVILSHSGCKAVNDNPRNIDDAHLKALAADGGVIQMNALSAYLIPTPKNPDRDAAMAALDEEGRRAADLTPGPAEGAGGRMTRPSTPNIRSPKATFDDYMKHMLHALKVAGVDHVGVGADMDGGGGVVGHGGHHRLPQDHRSPPEGRLHEGRCGQDLGRATCCGVMRQAEAYKASLPAT